MIALALKNQGIEDVTPERGVELLIERLYAQRQQHPTEEGGGEAAEVLVALDPECIHGENVREFYPEAVGMATGALEKMLTPGSRDQRDADILASCVVSEAFKALVAVSTSPSSTEEGRG